MPVQPAPQRIEKAVSRVEGVTRAEVNFASEKLAVDTTLRPLPGMTS